MPHQLLLGADALEKHHQLQIEEHDGVNRGATTACIGLMHELAHNGEVKCSLQVAIEVVVRHQFFQRHMEQRDKVSLLGSHHERRLSCAKTGNEEDP